MAFRNLSLISVAIVLALTVHLATGQTSEVMIKGAKGTKGKISNWGEITLYRDMTLPGSNKTLKTAEITVTFLRLSELNSDKQPIVDKNNKTHVMSSFNKQNFTCMASPNMTMPYSSNVKADCWYCWTDLIDIFAPAKFRITACVVQTNGTITQSQEVSNVTEGQVKLNIEMTKGWPWCDDKCPNGAGRFLDLDIGVKLPTGIKRAEKANSTRSDTRPTRFELGAGVTVEFSAMSLGDGRWAKLVDNTPVLTQQNTSNTVTMRFARFEENLLYDPTFDTGSVVYLPDSSGRLGALSLPLLLLVTIASAFVTSLIA